MAATRPLPANHRYRLETKKQNKSPTPLLPIIVYVFQIGIVAESKGVELPGQAGLQQYTNGRTRVSEQEKGFFARSEGNSGETNM